MLALRSWLRPQPHHCRRSVDVVRVVVAVILVIHPIYTLTHATALTALADGLRARGVPAATALAWLSMLAMLVAAPALLVRRLVAPAAVTAIVLLTTGAALLYAPRWYVAGGASVAGHPGVEFNVLLVACLVGVARAYWPRVADEARAARAGLDIIRLAGALLIMAHPLHAFITWDVVGMRRFGESMGELGLPFGVFMVWLMISWQVVCSLLIATRRLVVPACLGHIFVLGVGITIIHYPDWFIVGPGEGGMEFPIVYIACYVACILAYWPARSTATTRAR
jgi:putative oxidoreductase